jgi:energy-coupling factor transport system permease protein
MSDFEFLRLLPIGQYIPGETFLHRMDGRVKIVISIILLSGVIFAPRLTGLMVAAGFVMICLAVARVNFGFALRGLVVPLPFLLILAILQFFFNAQPDSAEVFARWGSLTLSLSDIWVALTLLARFAVLVLVLELSSFVISNSELIYGLNELLSPLKRIGVPTEDFVMVIQVALRFLPLLAQEAERIAKAQAARGAEWGTRQGNILKRIRQVVPLLIPLFLTSLRKANNLALAMDARAYGTTNRRTTLMEFRFRWQDGMALGLAAVITVLVVLL